MRLPLLATLGWIRCTYLECSRSHRSSRSRYAQHRHDPWVNECRHDRNRHSIDALVVRRGRVNEASWCDCHRPEYFRSMTPSCFAGLDVVQSLIGPSSPQTYSGTVCVLSGTMGAFDLDRSPVGPDRHRFRRRPHVSSVSLAVESSCSSPSIEYEARSTMAVQWL